MAVKSETGCYVGGGEGGGEGGVTARNVTMIQFRPFALTDSDQNVTIVQRDYSPSTNKTFGVII